VAQLSPELSSIARGQRFTASLTDSEPGFVANDVAGIPKPSNTINHHCKGTEKFSPLKLREFCVNYGGNRNGCAMVRKASASTAASASSRSRITHSGQITLVTGLGEQAAQAFLE
jgi:hypothetical protein